MHVRFNPYYQYMPKGYAPRPDLRNKACYIIYNDDGSVATGPSGEKYCFDEDKAKIIVAKLDRAKKRAAEGPASGPATAADPGGDLVFPCADGRIAIHRGDVFFLGNDGKNHGVILYGATDPDREIVAALRDLLRGLHQRGRAATMTGLQLLTLDPMAGTLPRSPAIAPRLLKNRR